MKREVDRGWQEEELGPTAFVGIPSCVDSHRPPLGTHFSPLLRIKG